MTFGENLINLRKQHKMTQEEVAEKLSITRQTVSNWELNQTKPDLDQLKGLSQLYKISLDKLAGNSVTEFSKEKANDMKNLLYRMGRFLFENKKLLFLIFTLLCIIAMGVCFIVDYAINHTITWSTIPTLSILFGYILILPIFAKRNKILLVLCDITVIAPIFLYLLEQVLFTKDWFFSIAFPIYIISIIGVWLSYLVCRFFKINLWYKFAILIFMWGVVLSPFINYVCDGLAYFAFPNIINIFSNFVFSLICGICGYVKTLVKKK